MSHPPLHSLQLFCACWVLCASSALAAEIRGVSLAHLHRVNLGYGSDDCRVQLRAVQEIGANWIAINDFAYMGELDRPAVRFGGDRTMREQNIIRCIEDAHAQGLKVLIKPHIWSHHFHGNGKWHGDIQMSSEQDWDEWFRQYGEYVLYHARIAQKTGCAMLCIGVEYQGTSASQEARWRKLIADVRQVYTGPLTYAAAFGEWPHIQWWDAVDYIGIDAYFPVATRSGATEPELRAGWANVYRFLEPLAKKWNRPILFTELGYSASVHAGLEPWSYDVVDPDPAFQALLYRVALEEAQKRDYIAGVFLWKWFTSDRFRRSEPFAIQDRPEVLAVLRRTWTEAN